MPNTKSDPEVTVALDICFKGQIERKMKLSEAIKLADKQDDQGPLDLTKHDIGLNWNEVLSEVHGELEDVWFDTPDDDDTGDVEEETDDEDQDDDSDSYDDDDGDDVEENAEPEAEKANG